MTSNRPAADVAVAETLGHWLSQSAAGIPREAEEMARRLFLDVSGLCIAARREPYVTATLGAVDRGGPCTAIGHPGGVDAFGAALINGTSAHGEDYDDTFEGGPVHSGAVIVPAVLAACEREGLGGPHMLVGIATGVELLCRLSLVAPQATHRAGFHPTAVFGAIAAAGGVAATLRLSAAEIVSALGIAGSMSSGIIEYLAEGTWTKRMHAGWAAQSGVRAALLARAGFVGPRTVLEGTHGVYRAFAPSVAPDFAPLVDGLGHRWIMQTVAFKPFACGTMTQPFVDCAITLAEDGVHDDDIAEIVCEVAEGTVHRLWEPLTSKHRPPTPYAAKFSTPFCMAVGFLDRKAGLAQFTDTRIQDPQVLALAAKIRYVVNPQDEYPRNFSGHLRATMKDGGQREVRQPHMRGGRKEPLSAADLEAKFLDNAMYGGWDRGAATRLLNLSRDLFALPKLDALMDLRA